MFVAWRIGLVSNAEVWLRVEIHFQGSAKAHRRQSCPPTLESSLLMRVLTLEPAWVLVKMLPVSPDLLTVWFSKWFGSSAQESAFSQVLKNSSANILQVTLLMLLQTLFINSPQLVRKALRDLWVCPQSLELSTASTDRLIILVLTQWNYKLFIPSWKKKEFNSSGSWMQHEDDLCYFYEKLKFIFHWGVEVALGLLAPSSAFKRSGLRGESGSQDSCELLLAFHNFIVWGPSSLLP